MDPQVNKRSSSAKPTKSSHLQVPGACDIGQPSSSSISSGGAAANPRRAHSHSSLVPSFSQGDKVRNRYPTYADSQASGKDTELREFNADPVDRFNGERRFSQEHHSQDVRAAIDGSETSRAGSNFTEQVHVDPRRPKRHLTFLDVAALVIDQMVGAGIFTTPGLVLGLTKSKPIALILWGLGGVHSFLCLIIFLEFGTALPYNGGALIYLDEMFPRPQLFATIQFSIFFILFAGTGGTAVVFAKYTLALAIPNTKISDMDDRLVSLVAVFVQTAVCFLLYFGRQLTLFLNKAFAFYKISLMMAIFIGGMTAINRRQGYDDFKTVQPGYQGSSCLSAMIYILFSYQGWENANYVAGEIKAPKRALRIGAFLGVGAVTALYILVTLAYYLVCDFETITKPDTDLGIAVAFAPIVFRGHASGMKTAIALSALGNMIAVVYTCTKVKQAIALQRIIPLFRFFGMTDRQFDTPAGALVLHWVLSTISIVVVPKNSDGYAFNVGLFGYGHLIILFFVGLGLFRLRKRMKSLEGWKPSYLTNKTMQHIVAIVFMAINVLMMYETALPKVDGSIPRYWWAVAMGVLSAFSMIYWSFFIILQLKLGDSDTVGQKIGLQVEVYKDDDAERPEDIGRTTEAANVNDGLRRRVDYKLSGHLKTWDGYIRSMRETLVRYVW